MDNTQIFMFVFSILSLGATVLILHSFKTNLDILWDRSEGFIKSPEAMALDRALENHRKLSAVDLRNAIRVITDGTADLRSDVNDIKAVISQLTDRVDSLETLIDIPDSKK